MTIERANRGSAAAAGFLIVSMIFVALAVKVKVFHNVPEVDADRGAERAKAFADMHAAEEISLDSAAVIDADHGTVRLPIDTAMQIAAQAGKDPGAARADLIARAEKAAKVLPKAPPKPSAFE
jgi:hypothetical protein